ncbi:MAG: hypothetical protein K1X65_09445 [Caldilineales bacterium]|nr:hypothetical protein [Caldilineales bacterium]
MLVCLAALWFFLAPVAQAQEGYPGGYTLMPLEPGPVQLLSLMVDASIRDDGAQAVVDVQVVYRLHNTDKNQPRPLRVAFPGYAVEGPPPESFSLQAAGRDIALRQGQQQWWVAEVTLAADERLNLNLTYSTPLGAGPFVRFRYPLDLTARLWPGRLESARFTLGFTQPPNPQSWLQLTPETYKQTAESITWSYDTVDPDAPIDYWLMRPAIWEQLRAARQAAVASASAAAQFDLGAVYTQLATGAGEVAVFDRYFPLAVAAYHRAQELAPAEPAAYLALAELYRLRAARSDPPDPTFGALATAQLAAALENGVQDPSLAGQVAAEYADLIASARQRGDFAAAGAYLSRLEALASRSQAPLETEAIAAERRRLGIEWAATTLRQQGPAAARAALAQALGADAATALALPFARLQSLQAAVSTQPGRRQIELTLSPRGAEGEALVQRLYEGLARSKAATVALIGAQPPVIQIDIPFVDGADLRQRQQTLAASIDPADVEWSGLLALLQPHALDWTHRDERWRTRDIYAETISLANAGEQIEAQAINLEQAAASVDPSHPLAPVLPDLLAAEAAIWRQLAHNQHARFTLTLFPRPGAALERTWAVSSAAAVTMAGQAAQYRPERFVWAAAAVWAAALALTAAAWWGMRGEM